MNESHWLDLSDFPWRVRSLPERVSARKLRLFACACCWRLGDWLNPIAREALRVAERYADGSASESERRAAFRDLVVSHDGEVWSETTEAISASLPFDVILHVTALAIATSPDLLSCRESGRAIAKECEPTRHLRRVVECSQLALYLAERYHLHRQQAARGCAGRVWNRFLHDVARRIDPAMEAALDRKIHRQELAHQTMLLRDILGNLSCPIAFSPLWRTDTALALTRQMYDSREFSAMLILADALQDAGCDNDQVLTHCRDTKQSHVRGCWVVDLVLQKERETSSSEAKRGSEAQPRLCSTRRSNNNIGTQ